MTDDDRYLSLAALATYSGLSVRALTRHCRRSDGPLPHYKVGGRVLVKRSEFDDWVRAMSSPLHRQRPTFDAKVREAAASLRRR